MKDHRLKRDCLPVLKFKGESLGSVSTERKGMDLWTDLELYRAVNGEMILSTIGYSDRLGHRDRYRVEVFQDVDDMLSKVERKPLFQSLLESAGVDDSEEL